MLIPRKNEFDLIEDMFRDPFFSHKENKLMKTDIRENEDNYLIDIDLPGYSKDNIKISVEDGYLIVNATVDSDNEESEKGKFVRKERYYGECSRSFYVGKNIETKDVKASFKNGTLCLEIPKIDESKKQSEKEYVQIED